MPSYIFPIILLILIALAICTFGLIFFIRRKGRNGFAQLLADVDKNAKDANAEWDNLCQPIRRLKDSDIDAYRTKYSNLTKQISEMKSHKYFNDELFRKSLVPLFELKVSNLQKLKDENNKVYDAIENLKIEAEKVMNVYKTLTAHGHYFAYSEMEDYVDSFQGIKNQVDLVFPIYAKYVTDENSNLLIDTIKNIEKYRKEHNKEFVERELDENKLYFDHILGTYPLDPQQRDSIVKLEDNCLVIASAGSGKTSTIVSKAKYLVEKQHINPARMLLLTYTRKAANELSERIKIEGLYSGTFHGLAYQIIAQTTGQAPSICEADVSLNIFHRLILHDDKFLQAINNYIINLQSLMKLEHDYVDAFAYFEDRKKYGIQALFYDVDGKIIFTRSEEEKRLCSMLTRLGVMFRYEHDYPFNTKTPERRQYKPDFTIYFQRNGQWQTVYLEHFAIDETGRVPAWFGEGTKGGWAAANKKYIEGIHWKRKTHRDFNTILIETTSADFRNGNIEQKLKSILVNCGVPIKERTEEELYNMLVKRNRQLEKSVFTLLSSFITLMKANEKSVDGLLKTIPNEDDGKMISTNDKRNRYILTNIIKPFYEAYQEELDKNYSIDFTDAIIQATQICREGLWQEYDYILVDEFQDISVDRYKLLQALRSEHPKTKLYCVGDDWQSIFRFAGSDMSLFYDFEKYFGFTEICKIETTYRFHQPLIDQSSEFVMKNKDQRRKSIKPPARDTKETHLYFMKCEGNDGTLKKAEEIVKKIPMSESVILMGRYNYDAMSLGFKGKIDNRDNKIKVNIAGRELFFLSVHSAKGLEADHVILVNCNQGAYGFPSLIEDDPILDFVLSKSESYPFAEERRLFYVAMTRAKKRMCVLYDSQRPSPFISEFLLKIETGSYLCPKCLEGKIMPIKDGVSPNGIKYRSFTCSNNEGGCDFFETRFGDLTPPGILITVGMTSQDVEKMREYRRRARKLS